jgi:AcrR family transcriptional regulator
MLDRDAYHHGDLQNALVTTATVLVEDAGPEAFSLREVARRVGVSANAAYRHFDDKSALLAAVAGHGFAQLAQHMERAMERATARRDAASPAVARFRAVGRAYVHFAADHPALFRLMFSARGVVCAEPDGASADEPARGATWALLGATLDALVAEGVLEAARRPGAEVKAWTVVHGFAALALDGHNAFGTGRVREAALESVLDFAVVGICGALPAPGTRKARATRR